MPPNYDSMIGKLLVHAPTRREAIHRMERALARVRDRTHQTTVPLQRRLMQNSSFQEGGIDIHFLERLLK